ncbi:GNAT family N-acetyltransferase [Chitinophaga sp.]|uniref:GNAT family N-acetyltransferase n=1 Tax=Chitinophaga sp. TaxID=1869181 RepID=UPI00260CC287|nr:GNAT family N-acetyltransferase [uncultured Chitinophaga sp.]
MPVVQLHQLQSADTGLIHQIAEWYYAEWHLSIDASKAMLQAICSDPHQIQAVLLAGDIPVATGSICHHVGLQDRVPRLASFGPWLARVYTVPAHRGKGYGSAICRYLQSACGEQGISTLYLFTDTAELLYAKLGWGVMERLETGGRALAVMHLHLSAPF